MYKIFMRRAFLDISVTPAFVLEELSEQGLTQGEPGWMAGRARLFKVRPAGLGLRL